MTKKIEGMVEITDLPNGELKLQFAPGCFDQFDGTQAELDEVMATIKEMFESGAMEANATLVDIDDLLEEDPEMAMKILESFNEEDRKLQ